MCQCQHLTNFAVLMDISSSFSRHPGLSSLLTQLTLACSSLSIIFLALCIWIFTCVPALKSDRSRNNFAVPREGPYYGFLLVK